MFETADLECIIDWTFTVTLVDGSELPSFIRFYEESYLLVVMPHAHNETGEFSVKATARAVEDTSLSYTETISVSITSNKNLAFKTSPYRGRVAVGDTIKDPLPAIYNPYAMDYTLKMDSGPSWVAFSSSSRTFTYSPSLDDFLDGSLQTGVFEIKMSWNAKSSQDFTGSYLGVSSLQQGDENFYQGMAYEVDLFEMPSELEAQISSTTNLTDSIQVVVAWTSAVEYKDGLIVARRLATGQATLLDDIFSFQMKSGSTLELPLVEVASYDENGVTLRIIKSSGEEFTLEELTDQVLLLTILESYEISSY